jgi:MFS family permease
MASVGLAGAIAAFFAVKLTDWRMAYFIGGGMGLILLILRVNVLESIVFNKSLEKRGSKPVPWWTIFTSWSRFVRYLRCMGIGLPTYMVIGIYSTFGNEFAKALGHHRRRSGGYVRTLYIHRRGHGRLFQRDI